MHFRNGPGGLATLRLPVCALPGNAAEGCVRSCRERPRVCEGEAAKGPRHLWCARDRVRSGRGVNHERYRGRAVCATSARLAEQHGLELPERVGFENGVLRDQRALPS
jgi:hypothetical protein